MLSTVLIIVMIVAILGALPNYSYSRAWGWGPSGIVGLILVVVLLLALTGHL